MISDIIRVKDNSLAEVCLETQGDGKWPHIAIYPAYNENDDEWPKSDRNDPIIVENKWNMNTTLLYMDIVKSE